MEQIRSNLVSRVLRGGVCGATIEQARVQIDAIAILAPKQSPKANQDWGVKVMSLLDYETSRV